MSVRPTLRRLAVMVAAAMLPVAAGAQAPTPPPGQTARPTSFVCCWIRQRIGAARTRRGWRTRRCHGCSRSIPATSTHWPPRAVGRGPRGQGDGAGKAGQAESGPARRSAHRHHPAIPRCAAARPRRADRGAQLRQQRQAGRGSRSLPPGVPFRDAASSVGGRILPGAERRGRQLGRGARRHGRGRPVGSAKPGRATRLRAGAHLPRRNALGRDRPPDLADLRPGHSRRRRGCPGITPYSGPATTSGRNQQLATYLQRYPGDTQLDAKRTEIQSHDPR